VQLLRHYLDNLTGALARIFGAALRGVYVTGSGAVGDYLPGRSDIDVLVVVDGADRPALDAVVTSCRHDVLPCPAAKLELVVYELGALDANSGRPRWSLNFETGASTHHVGVDPDAEPAHWFVLDLAFARSHALPLLGPETETLIPPVADSVIATALDEMVRWYEDNEPEQAAMARARAGHWRATREFIGKPRGYPPATSPDSSDG
jgi:hypothetical protein